MSSQQQQGKEVEMKKLNFHDLRKAKKNVGKLVKKHQKEDEKEEEPKLTKVAEVIKDEWKVRFIKDSKGVEAVPTQVLKPDASKVGYKRPKVEKKKPTRGGTIGRKKEWMRIDGKWQEVEVRVLPAGNEYYVGKSVPSGMAPWGTKDDEEKAEDKAERRFENYLARRLDSAADAEAQGRRRKGGDAEAYREAMDNLDELKEAAVRNGINLEGKE